MQATAVQANPTTPIQPSVITVTGADGTAQNLIVPMNRQEVSALRSQRTELSNQLESAADRRHQLSEELKSAPAGASRTGLEQRIAVLDKRMVQLESDIAATGRQLTAAPLDVLGSSEMQGRPMDIPDNVAAISATAIVMLFFPIVFVFCRNMWKRGNRGAIVPQQQASGETNQRLERLEQGVEAIAIEIERIAEGQRFVTRLMSEGQPAGIAIGSGHAQEARAQASGQ